MMRKDTLHEQEPMDTTGKASLLETVIFITLLFGLPVPFVFLVHALHRFAMGHSLAMGFAAYGLLVATFVETATKIIRWTANIIVSKHGTEEGKLMTPLVLVVFPQWVLFLVTILNALDDDAMHHEATKGEINTGFIWLSALMTVCIPLLIIARAFRQAWKEIEQEEQRQKLNRKTDEPTRRIIALSRNVQSKRFNGVTSCLKLV